MTAQQKQIQTSGALNLPPALSGERRTLSGAAGELSYYVAGQGAPLLLIHSVNAAASAYEVRPLYEHYAQTRRVYALELPGYGFSERSQRNYTPQLMTEAILEIRAALAQETGQLPDALAISLSCEFLARAAFEQPGGFRSIALVSPTGFNKSYPRYGPPGSTREVAGLEAALRFGLWRQGLFAALTTRPSIRFFIEKTFGRKDFDRGVVAYAYVTAHQPGAENAPFAFLSAKLFSNDISRIYEQLELPVWLLHGTRGDFTDYTRTDTVSAKPNWKIEVLETGALPHFEVPDTMFARYDAFLRGAH